MSQVAYRMVVGVLALALAPSLRAQNGGGTVELHVRSGPSPVANAAAAAGATATVTDKRGIGKLELPAGSQVITVEREAYEPARLSVSVIAGQTAVIDVQLRRLSFESEVTVVAATRTGAVLEDQPLHVEALPQEEVEENLTMAPGNLTTLFAELPGLHMETTAPTHDGVGLRLRGLRGRYTRVLVDELPRPTPAASTYGSRPLDDGRLGAAHRTRSGSGGAVRDVAGEPRCRCCVSRPE
ncbi:MAG TPA: hypothetical protein VH394_25760 [Thermoanaerobaculia bacterium]|jgi:hypothetical protein|nr:hypothetical protein [Thermoanaerobaculia bacterium]